MKVVITWWNLDDSPSIVTSLKALVDRGPDDWRNVDGLRSKLWLHDPDTNRWGAVMLWDCDRDHSAPLPPNAAMELIGKPPAVRLVADVVASVGVLTGNHQTAPTHGNGAGR